jgi:hypothetical protein
VPNHLLALFVTAAFVIVSQLKINVMNAYAGSLAWSNFFSRLTHSHPGRVVWLFFNVAIALLLMELGIYKLLEETLGVFSIVASAWLCAISADLFINKPLGLAPPGIEFKRAHLYDINPVGFGGMAITVDVALAAHFGLFGSYVGSLAIYLVPIVAFRRRAGLHGLGDQGQILSGAQAAASVEEPFDDHLLDLRASVRARGHGVVPGLCRRRSVRCAARSTAAATISASPRRACNTRFAKSPAPSCRRRDGQAVDPHRPLQHDHRDCADLASAPSCG